VAPSIEFTERIVLYSALLGNLVLAGIIGVSAFYLVRIRLANRRWLTACLRSCGALLVLVLAFPLLWMVGDFGYKPKVFVSPDSQHIAAYTYEAGFLGRDMTVVTVRGKWSIWREEAYVYEGPSDWGDTEVHWVDDKRLAIRYFSDATRFQKCKAKVAGVTVDCVPLTR
jgi:hypothetical protein